MEKKVFIVNGSGGVGKDTFCGFVGEYIHILTVSSITPIKAVAKLLGWDGTKDEKSRKFLSDLKDVCTEYNDLPMDYLRFAHNMFIEGTEDISRGAMVLFIHIREPKEIERAVKEFNAKTILIKSNRVPAVQGNHADENVMDYHYDFVINNNGTLDDLRKTAENFVYQLFRE